LLLNLFFTLKMAMTCSSETYLGLALCRTWGSYSSDIERFYRTCAVSGKSFYDSVDHAFTFRAQEQSKDQDIAGRKLRWNLAWQTLLPWSWRRTSSPKHLLVSEVLHDEISQKVEIFILQIFL
jgi:hypothetical protein